MTTTQLRLWTVDEYHRMFEADILTTEDRVELLEGRIIQMSPQQPPHAATTQRTWKYLYRLLLDKADIRVQLPITLRPNSEPEPDIAVVRINSREYIDAHPTADDPTFSASLDLKKMLFLVYLNISSISSYMQIFMLFLISSIQFHHHNHSL